MLFCGEVMERLDSSYSNDNEYMPPGCCDSCHDDAEEGYPLCETEFDGEEAYVCCATLRAIEDQSTSNET